MNKSFFLFILLLSHLSGFSQINIQKVSHGDSILNQIRYGNSVLAILSVQAFPKDTVYHLDFENTGYYLDRNTISNKGIRKTPRFSFIFDGTSKTIDTLYKTLISVLDKKNRNNPNFKIELLLGETEVSINPVYADGEYNVQINGPSGYVILSKRQIKKLLILPEKKEEL